MDISTEEINDVINLTMEREQSCHYGKCGCWETAGTYSWFISGLRRGAPA
ncbi:MAG: hypothetical protein JSV37_11785 [Anaerolineaceae bacterium]|nr:MAG: hypothetical protein JSV37_11785 [Anaerolineaceae bacterium]